MEFQVNTNNVILSQIDQVESGEYNVTECNFTFSSEFDGLTKKAVFTGEDGTAYLQTIVDGKCSIPSEILTTSQVVQIGVYAYAVENEELILRYSPEPTDFFIHEGSYKEAQNSTPPTPSEVEQLQAQITSNKNDIEELQGDVVDINQDIVDIKAEQITQNENIQTNANNISTINEQISDINETISNLETNKANVTDLNALTERVSTNERDIDTIDGHISDINQNIDDLEQDLTNYSLITETGSQINLNINSSNFQMTAILKDKNGNVIHTSNVIDLPLETMVVGASYDNVTKEVVLTLQNGTTLRFSVADLVSGLVSTDQLTQVLSNYYNKNEVDALIPDLTDYVKNTDYATASKGGVLKAYPYNNFNVDANGLPYVSSDSYENYIAKSNYTFISKGTLENVITGKELINQTQLEESQALQDTEIEALQAENAELKQDITNMAKAMYKVDGQGSDITLPNTSENKFVEFGLEGRTEQEQLSGKNILNATAESYTLPATSTTYQAIVTQANKPYLEGGTKYYISYNIENASTSNTRSTPRLYLNSEYVQYASTNANLTVGRKVWEFTPSVSGNYEVQYWLQGSNVAVTVSQFMISTSSDTSYEPYCGGIPSPNPDYPQAIKNVTGNANVKIQNKNLFDKENGIVLGKRIDENDTIIKDNTGFYQELYISVKPNTQYTVTHGDWLRIFYYKSNKEYLTFSLQRGAVSRFTTPENCDFIRVAGSQSLSLNNDLQIEQGSTATSYVPHQEQNLPLTLGDIELNQIDDKKDYFFKQNEKWYLHKEIGVKKGDFNWVRGNESNPNVYDCVVIEDYATSNNIPICNYFIGINNVASESSMNSQLNKIAFRADRNYYRLYVKTTLTKEQLNALNLELYYKLYQPTDTEITDTTLIEQLEATLQARSYDDITYITSESDELGFNMNVVAVADANKVIDSELQEIKSAVIALGGDLNV